MPNIDERVVQMTFDNQQFERGVSTSLKTLEDLKKALDFKSVEGSLKNIEHAFNGVDLSGLSRSIDTIADKFSPLGILGVTAMQRISNAAIDAGKKVADAFLGFGDMSAGQSKYETQTKAVQTITNATGKSVEEVEKVLEKLQKYTDETSYDFAEMVSSIGKFTSVGVELERAEKAMEGIANEAAKSGAGKAEANRAMYNFAQAMSAGYVKLIDWKSIENANMATKEFKETLIDTAINAGILKKKGDGVGVMLQQTSKGTKEIVVDYKSFNETLKDQWLTSDVLVSTLERYSDTTTDFGLSAYYAAQKALTWSDALDAVKDAVSSGWMQTFKYLFGDLNEAQDLWTWLAEALVEYTDIFASYRNEVLKAWHEQGGYTAAIEAAHNIWETFMNIVLGIKQAFENIIPPMTADRLVEITEKIRDASVVLRETFGLYKEVEEEETEASEELNEQMTEMVSNLEDVSSGLKRGMKGNEVKKLQKLLNELGVTSEDLVEDGIFGPKTQAAVEALQGSLGVAISGTWDEATQAALKTEEALSKLQSTAKKGLGYGDKNDEVKQLQKNLNSYLHAQEKLVVDGIYGSRTQAAVKAMQKKLGVEQTGQWDEVTQAAFESTKATLLYVKGLDKALSEGFSGDAVKKLQEELIAYGYMVDGAVADGVYGPETSEAIRELQRDLGVKVTGEWDKATYLAVVDAQRIRDGVKGVAQETTEASEETEDAVDNTSMHMMRLQERIEGLAAAVKIITNFAKSIGKIGINVAKMFAPILEPLDRFTALVSNMVVNLSKSLEEDDAYGKFVANVTNAFKPLGSFIENVGGALTRFLDAYDKFIETTGRNNTFGNFFTFLKSYFGDNKVIGFVIKLAQKAGAIIGRIIGFIKDRVEEFIEFIQSDTFKEGKDNVFAWIAEKWKWLTGLFSNVSLDDAQDGIFGWIRKIRDAFAKLFAKGKQSESGLFIDEWKERLSGFVEIFKGIKTKITEWFNWAKSGFPGIGEIIGNFIDDIKTKISNLFSIDFKGEPFSFLDKIKEKLPSFESIAEWFKDFGDKIRESINDMFGLDGSSSKEIGKSEKRASVLDKILEYIPKLILPTIGAFITYTLFGIVKAIKHVSRGFDNITDALKASFGKKEEKDKIGDTALKIAGSIMIVAAAVGLLSIIDAEKAGKGLEKFIWVLGSMVGALVLIDKYGGKHDPGKQALMLAGSIGIIALSLWLMCRTVDKYADKPGVIIGAFAIIELMLASLVGAAILISKFGNGYASVSGILAMCAGLFVIVLAFKKMAKVVDKTDPGVLVGSLAIIEVLLLTLGGISVLIAGMGRGNIGARGILAMCAGLYIVVLAFKKMVGVVDGTDFWVLVGSLAIIEVLLLTLGGISIAMSTFGSGTTKVAGLVALCAGLYVVVLAFEKMVNAISSVDEATAKMAFGFIETLLATIGMVAVAMSAVGGGLIGGIASAISFLSLAFAVEKIVTVFGEVLAKIKDVNPNMLKTFFDGIAAAMAVLGVLVIAFGNMPVAALFGSLGLLAVFGVLAAGIGIIANVAESAMSKFSRGIEVIGWGLESFADSTKDLDMAKLKAVANFIRKTVPPMIRAFMGLNLDNYSKQTIGFKAIGRAIKIFGKNVSSVSDKTLASAEKAKTLLDKAKEITEKLNSLVIPSKSQLADFFLLGTDIYAYSYALSEVKAGDSSAFSTLIQQTKEILEIVTDDSKVKKATSNLTALGGAFGVYYGGLSGVKYDESGNAIAPPKIDSELLAERLSQLISAFSDEQVQQLTKFGEDAIGEPVALGISELAIALGSYADNISKLKEEDINRANGIIATVSGVSTAYDDGNISGFYNAYSDYSFAQSALLALNIFGMGLALKSYGENIGKLNPQNVKDANSVLETIAGIRSKLIQQNKPWNVLEALMDLVHPSEHFELEQFSSDIEALGQALEEYADGISGLTLTKVLYATSVLEHILSVGNRLPHLQSWWQNFLFGSDNKLGAFSQNLGTLGQDLGKFSKGISQGSWDEDSLEASYKAIERLLSLNVDMPNQQAWWQDFFNGKDKTWETLSEGLGSLGTNLTEFSTNVKDIKADEVETGLATFERLVKTISQVHWAELKSIDELGIPVDKFDAIGSGIVRLFTTLGNSFKSEDAPAKKALDELSGIGQKIVDKIADDVTVSDKTILIDSLSNGISTSLNTVLVDDYSKMENFGKSILDWIKSGMDDSGKRDELKNSIRGLIISLAAAGKQHRREFVSLGEFLDYGIIEGINNEAIKVREAAEKVLRDAYEAAKAAVGVASPSKEFMWLGEMLGEGLVQGIESYSSIVGSAAAQLSEGAVTNATNGVMSLSDIIGLGDDFEQPVIRPVLDLTDVQDGMVRLNKFFDSSAIVASSSAAFAGAIAAHESHRRVSEEPVRNDSVEKELSMAIDRLNEKMSSMSDEISNLNVYLDGTILAGYMTPRIDRKLGTNAMLAGRMN